jgi:hypothetical protein
MDVRAKTAALRRTQLHSAASERVRARHMQTEQESRQKH